MIKTDPTMLVYDATPGPWTTADRYDLRHNPCGMDIVKDMNYMRMEPPAKGGKAFTETWSNARLICAAPPLLKVAQKLLKYRVVNEALIPRQYLTVDHAAVGRVVSALGGRAKIPGIEVYEETVIAAGGRR